MAVIPDPQGAALTRGAGDQRQEAHPYTQGGFTPRRAGGSNQ